MKPLYGDQVRLREFAKEYVSIISLEEEKYLNATWFNFLVPPAG